jgi:uncharacterized DUF497 family protein
MTVGHGELRVGRKKATRNLRDHGVSFEEATRVFNDPIALDDIDDREDYGEERSNMIGVAGDRLLVVTCTLRRGQRRASSPRAMQSRTRGAEYRDENN